LIRNGNHLQESGIRQILEIRKGMNDGGAGKRKYSDAEIIKLVKQSGKSPETTRQARE
jgi:hypothetical protein